MSLVVDIGAPYLPPVAAILACDAREPWSAAAIGIDGGVGRTTGARCLRLGVPDADLLPTPPGIDAHAARRRHDHDGPAGACGPVAGGFAHRVAFLSGRGDRGRESG